MENLHDRVGTVVYVPFRESASDFVTDSAHLFKTQNERISYLLKVRQYAKAWGLETMLLHE